jgi:hypothetical protein
MRELLRPLEPGDLRRFVAWIHATGVEGQPLASHLDAYKALAMYNALERGARSCCREDFVNNPTVVFVV